MQLKTKVQDRLHQNSFDEYIKYICLSFHMFSWLLSKSWWRHIKQCHQVESGGLTKKRRSAASAASSTSAWWLVGSDDWVGWLVDAMGASVGKYIASSQESETDNTFCQHISDIGMLHASTGEVGLVAKSEPKWDFQWFTSNKAGPRSSNAQVPETSDSWRCVGRDPKRRSNLKEHTNRLRHHLGSFETPKTTAIYLDSISHDGSMVLVYANIIWGYSDGIHGTPLIWQHHGSVMGSANDPPERRFVGQDPTPETCHGLKPLVKTCWTSIE